MAELDLLLCRGMLYGAMMVEGAMKAMARAIFNRRTVSELLVVWFAVWILWWFRRWVGHGPAYFPNPQSPEARAFYSVEMRTLARSLLQSFVISAVALLAWRVLLRRAAAGRDGSSPDDS
jgi:hypothetical protein